MTSPSRTTKVQEANAKMMAAWKEGRELLDRLGPRAKSGTMLEASGQDLSEAERLRKLRAVASRMTEKEVKEICNRCEKAVKPLGPQFLVALSRLPTRAERRKAVTQVLKLDWGLKELQRFVRVQMTGSSESHPRNRRQAGRHRKLNYLNPAEVRDEIEGMCVSWQRFHRELVATAKQHEIADWKTLVPSEIREKFAEVTATISQV